MMTSGRGPRLVEKDTTTRNNLWGGAAQFRDFAHLYDVDFAPVFFRMTPAAQSGQVTEKLDVPHPVNEVLGVKGHLPIQIVVGHEPVRSPCGRASLQTG